MFSLTSNTSTTRPPHSLFSTLLRPHHHNFLRRPPPSPSHKPLPKPISATIIIPPSSPNPQQQQQLYQPFRPPPSPLPTQFTTLDTVGRLQILSDRLGLWFQYAPLIPSLYQDGFTPSSLEEATGIPGVEQNRVVVGAQVRDSLLQSSVDPETLSFFDTGGADLLYEIRLLSAAQRAAAACYIVANRLDAKGAQELARAMKDFPRRRGDKGWESFDFKLPGDCLAFMRFRQSREHQGPSPPRTGALESALAVAESEAARARVSEELEGGSGADEEAEGAIEDAVRVPVVRIRVGEVAEAKAVVVLPVCRAEGGDTEREMADAPWECRSEGEFGVVVAEKGWRRWVALPAWEPVAGLADGGGVVVEFSDARALPWKVNRLCKEEAILVVADRRMREVAADDGLHLAAVSRTENGGVGGGGGGLKVERGWALRKMGMEQGLGRVVLVVRPPKEEIDDQLSDEDWE